MGRVNLCIVFFLSLLGVTIATYECGKQADGKTCGDYACCSQWGYCGLTYEYCSPDRKCQSNCVPFGEVVTNVTSYYAYLNKNDYDLAASNVECSQWFSDKSYEWRSKYEWTGFCGPVGPQLRAACGKCLKVTNLGTGANTTVRIVDTCGSGGLDLDEKPFYQIDTDGKGHQQGHLTVSYEFVECGDEPKLISMVV